MKLSLFSAMCFLIKQGGPIAYLKKYGRLLKSYGQAWDSGNIEKIIDHFADDFIYTDCISQSGIRNKTDLRTHLNEVFKLYPRQKWTTNATMYPHFTPYKFAISYEFKMEGEHKTLTGTGMEKLTFQGDKLVEDRIHMIINELNSRSPLGFKN